MIFITDLFKKKISGFQGAKIDISFVNKTQEIAPAKPLFEPKELMPNLEVLEVLNDATPDKIEYIPF